MLRVAAVCRSLALLPAVAVAAGCGLLLATSAPAKPSVLPRSAARASAPARPAAAGRETAARVVGGYSAKADLGYPWPDAPCQWGGSGACRNYDWWLDENHNGRLDGTCDKAPRYDSSECYDPLGYEYRNCTSYVAWKLESLGVPVGLLGNLGNAADWKAAAVAKKKSWPLIGWGTTPRPGAAAINPNSAAPWGHVAFVESVNRDGTITVSEYNSHYAGAGDTWTGKASARGFTQFVYFDQYEGLSRSEATNKIVTVTATNTSYFYDGVHLRWIPDVETYWCLRNVQHRGVVTATQAQADRLGNGQPWVSPCFDPQRVINHIVREQSSGQAYYVTSGGTLGTQPTLWHPINDSATYNCLANSGVGVIQSNWTQINSLRIVNGQKNEGPPAICSTGSGAPTITSIPDITIGRNDSGSYPATVNYRDDDCDIVGGTWVDPSGVSHEFGNGSDSSHVAGCAGGSGYLTPGYGSCTSPQGQHSNPARYAQTITIRDKLGRVSAPFVFYIVCQ